jgi:hypothetical protein
VVNSPYHWIDPWGDKITKAQREDAVQSPLNRNTKTKRLMKALREKKCPIPQISCECCKSSGSFDPASKNIKVCYTNSFSKREAIKTVLLIISLVFLGGCLYPPGNRQVVTGLRVKLERIADMGDGEVIYEGVLVNTSTSTVQLSRFDLGNAMLRVVLSDPSDEAFSVQMVPSLLLRDPPLGEAYFMDVLGPNLKLDFSEAIPGSLDLQGRDMARLQYSVNWTVNMRDASGRMGKALLQGTGLVDVQVRKGTTGSRHSKSDR